MKRLDTWKFATALALTLAILSGACALAVVVAPDATIAVFNSWMHGVDLAKLVPPGGRPVTPGQVIAGMVSLGIIGFVAGAVLAAAYNAMTAAGNAEAPIRRST
jgi:2TM family of unknown function (DUF5676)